MVSTLEQMQVPNGTGPGVQRSQRPLLASRTRCNVLWKPPNFGNKVNICGHRNADYLLENLSPEDHENI